MHRNILVVVSNFRNEATSRSRRRRSNGGSGVADGIDFGEINGEDGETIKREDEDKKKKLNPD